MHCRDNRGASDVTVAVVRDMVMLFRTLSSFLSNAYERTNGDGKEGGVGPKYRQGRSMMINAFSAGGDYIILHGWVLLAHSEPVGRGRITDRL